MPLGYDIQMSYKHVQYIKIYLFYMMIGIQHLQLVLDLVRPGSCQRALLHCRHQITAIN